MKLHRLLPLLVVVLCWSSCQSLYIPNTPNVPLMSEGDELQVGGQIGSNGYGATLAYSPYYHWAVAGSFNTFSIRGGAGYPRTELSYRHINWEGSTGFYTRLSKFARLEALAGYGMGQTGHPDDNNHLYRKLFIQPSLGISGPYVDAGFTPRFTYVMHYRNVVQGGQSNPNESAAFFEPALTLRAGMEEFKFQMQGGLAFPMGSAPFSYRNRFLTFGIHLTFVKDFDKYK